MYILLYVATYTALFGIGHGEFETQAWCAHVHVSYCITALVFLKEDGGGEGPTYPPSFCWFFLWVTETCNSNL